MEWENEWNCLCYSTLTSRKNTGQEKRFRLCMVLTPFPWCNPHPSLLLSLFLLHLNGSKVNDTHFLMKSNDAYLVHSSCSVCCLWHHCPTTLLIFLFLISDSTTWFLLSFLLLLPFLISHLLDASHPIKSGHPSNLSLFYLHIHHHVTQFSPKETSRSQKIYRNQRSANK